MFAIGNEICKIHLHFTLAAPNSEQKMTPLDIHVNCTCGSTDFCLFCVQWKTLSKIDIHVQGVFFIIIIKPYLSVWSHYINTCLCLHSCSSYCYINHY